jgi:hypothetical protein
MRLLAACLLLCSCYDFGADLAAYCSDEHPNCPLSCPDGGVCHLAANQNSVFDLTLHGNTLYWAQDVSEGSIWTMSLSGGDASPLINAESYPISVVADDSAIYWADFLTNSAGTLNRYDVATGVRSTVLDHVDTPCRLRLSQNTLYWSEHPSDAGNSIDALPLAGGPAQLLANGQSLCRFDVTSQGVYWPDNVRDGGVYGLTLGGAPTELDGPFDFVNAVVADSSYVYWVVYGLAGSVWRAQLDGGSPTQLVSNQSKPATLVTDGVSVYYGTFSADGQVLKVPASGGDPVVIAKDQIQPLVQAVDDQFVYWSTLDTDGGIFRAPK